MLVLVILIVVAVIFLMSVAFRVENIQVIGNVHYSASEIVNAIDILIIFGEFLM
jgi:cell division septal protein FtsQ